MTEFWALGLGGFLGATARYYIASYANRILGTHFPLGTFTVNIIGCFLLGLIATIAETRVAVHPLLKTFLTVGMLGAFTTFSTFSYETLVLLKAGHVLTATMNIMISLILGLFAAYLGMSAARFV